MKVSVEVEIAKPKNTVWASIIDINNCSEFISSIIAIEILNQPESGLVGLKWKETRQIFGKKATEIMWITDAVENEYYCTRAESHGSVYVTKISLSEAGENTILRMLFSCEAQTTFVGIVSACMGFLLKRSMKKMVLKDLEDIKKYVDQSQQII